MGAYRNIGYRPGSRLYAFFSPTVSAVPVPAPYDISIGGRLYAAQLLFEPYRHEAYRHRSEPPQRESLNFDNIPGENVVNTSGLWRRDQNDWLFGAGQLVLDEKKAADNRFYQSKGVNPWTQYQLSLLNDTTKTYGIINANTPNTNFLRIDTSGKYKYYLENDALYWEDTTKTVTAVVHTTASSGQPNLVINSLGNIANGMFATDIAGLGSYQAGTTISSHSGSGPYTLVLSNNLTASIPAGTVVKFVNGTDLPAPGSSAAYYKSISHNSSFVFVAAGTAGIYYIALGATTGSVQYATSNDIDGGINYQLSSNYTAGGYTLTPSAVAGIQVGMAVYDKTHPSYVQPGTVVQSVGATTVTVNQPLLHNINSSTDNLIFSFVGQSALINTVGGYSSVFWGADNLWATAGPYILNWGGSSNQAGSGYAPSWVNLMPVDVDQNWTWHGWAQGNSQIYIGGYNTSGGQYTDGAVYRIGQQIQETLSGTITTTSTSYYAPAVALRLTPGEYPVALFPYLNYICVGTNLGMRFCRTLSLYDPTATATGDLEGGPLIPNILQPVTNPVTSFTAYGRYLYFAWTNYDSGSTGIGRADVTDFIDNLAPAYASDLMVTGQGEVHLKWDQATNAPLIAVSGTTSAGAYSQAINCVPSGYVDSGWLTFDIPDTKTLMWMRPQFNNNAGSVNCFILANGPNPSFKQVGTETAAAGDMGTEFQLTPYIQADKFRAKLQLVRDPTTPSTGPILTRWTVRGLPNVSSETLISAVINLSQEMNTNDSIYRIDPYEEFIALENWRRNQTVVQFVEGSLTVDVTIDQIDWLPYTREDRANQNFRGFQGIAVVFMKTVAPYQYTPVSG